MDNSIPILGGQTPQQYADSGDAEKQREVLTILARIDCGMIG